MILHFTLFEHPSSVFATALGMLSLLAGLRRPRAARSESVHLAASPGLQHEKLTILPAYKQQPLVSPGRLRASKGLPWFVLSGPWLHARNYPNCHWP